MLTAAIFVAASCLIVAKLWATRRGRLPAGLRSPPGPPGLPLLGNLFDVPPKDSHLTYLKLAEKYGPIFQLKVLHRTFVIISDVKIALDLLDKRGAIYSDRPKFHMADAAGWEWDMVNMGHGDEWRVRRRLIHQRFYANATVQTHGLIRRTTIEFARNLLSMPENFRHHIRRSAAATIMEAVYGITIADENDPYVDIAETAINALGECMLPGSNLIDLIPILRYVPPWVPILGYWPARALELRKYPTDMIEVPYARTKEDIKHGTAKPSMVTENLEIMEADAAVTEQVIKDACAVSYLGGADTTVSTLVAFVMAMVLWPEYQAKAQEELDRVLGDRLPEFSDQESLPYVEAIIRETYRKYPVTPMAVPHAIEEDDVYEGLLIRKGSVVMGNVWALMHDESVYRDAQSFNPDRFIRDGKLDPSSQDPRVAIFGFGRRICPGRYFADASVFLTIATALKCFQFGLHIENGVPVPPSGEIHTGIVSCPVPFKCSIKPRSPNVEAMIDMASQTCEE